MRGKRPPEGWSTSRHLSRPGCTQELGMQEGRGNSTTHLELVLLNHSAHGTINDHDALRVQVQSLSHRALCEAARRGTALHLAPHVHARPRTRRAQAHARQHNDTSSRVFLKYSSTSSCTGHQRCKTPSCVSEVSCDRGMSHDMVSVSGGPSQPLSIKSSTGVKREHTTLRPTNSSFLP